MGGGIRRVVTGRDSQDVSYFTSVEVPQPVSVGGMQVINLWGTGDERRPCGQRSCREPPAVPVLPRWLETRNPFLGSAFRAGLIGSDRC